MKKKIFGVLQRIGRSFMLPIAVLPIAGMFLGIGSSLTNEATIASLGLESILGTGTTLNHILILLMSVGQTIFDNLPLIFAASVALGMAKKSKEELIRSLEKEMKQAAKDLDFEQAATLRDIILELRSEET